MASSGNDLRPWGMALERLREERGINAAELCYRVRMGQPQYHKICTQSKDGPTIETLERLLKALGCTWGEWGHTYDAVQAGLARELHPQDLKAAVGERLARAPEGAPKPLVPRGSPPHRTRRGTTKTHP